MQQLIELFNNDPQLFWSIALSILSVVLVVMSVVVSVLTLRQNSKMIEGEHEAVYWCLVAAGEQWFAYIHDCGEELRCFCRQDCFVQV